MEHPRAWVTASLKGDDEPPKGRQDRGIAPSRVVELEIGPIDGGVEEDGTAGVDEGVGRETGAAEDKEVVALLGGGEVNSATEAEVEGEV